MNFSIPLPFDFLPTTAFVYMAVFARVGSMLLMFPAFGERNIPGRVKIMIAAVIVFAVTPVVRPTLPLLPDGVVALALIIGTEVVVGLALGALVRMIMGTLQVTGTIIAFQSGLAMARGFDPTQGVQSALMGTLISVLAVTMILVTDLHHLLLAGIVDSYSIYAPGRIPPVQDFMELAVRTASDTFLLAIQLASPFLVVGLTVYMGVGILSRLMPAVQIFFIVMPANILIGFSLLMLLIGTMIMTFLGFFEGSVTDLLMR